MLVHAVGLADLDVDEAGGAQRRLELLARQRAGDAAGPLGHVGAGRLVHVGVGDHVGDGEAPAGAQDARGLAQHLRLVAGEVDHAVGDHDVDGRVGERQLLDVALDELDVLDAGLLRVGARERRASRRSCRGRWPCRSGRRGRAEMRTSAPAPAPRSRTVSPSCRSATAVGTPQPSEACTAACGTPSTSPRSYIASPKTCSPCASVVSVSVPQQLELSAAGAAAAALVLGDGAGRGGVALADGLADLGVGQLSHEVSSFSASGRT